MRFHRSRCDDVFAAIDHGPARQVLQHQIVRFSHLGLQHPGRVRTVDPRGDADFAVGDQVDHGAVGGGLGDLAYRYGYLSYKSDYMLVTVALLIVLVQLLQMLGDRIVARYSRR